MKSEFKTITYQPSKDLGTLFSDVALCGIFDDGKIWADAIPKSLPKDIVALYEKIKNKHDFDLRSFIYEHFSFSDTAQVAEFQSDTSLNVEQHVISLWQHLKRVPEHNNMTSTLISLPYPYIVPGGRFNEIYYWDSYFTMLGLDYAGEHEMIENMIDNFAWMISAFGFIPNGNRTYYLSRSQPPYFALMVELLSQIHGKWAIKYSDALLAEYSFWMQSRSVTMSDGVLNRYFDNDSSPRTEMYAQDVHSKGSSADPLFFTNTKAACESGWDFSSRWLDDYMNLSTIHTTDILPVDLNCLLYILENAIAKSYRESNNSKDAELFEQNALARKELIFRYFWDENQGYFFDYNLVKSQRTDVISVAGIYPLFIGICDDNMASRAIGFMMSHLMGSGGLLTTDRHTGQQWDAPNGWAPLQWIAFVALKNYKAYDHAISLADKWTSLLETVFKNTGKMLEKYNVEDISLLSGGGEYPVQDGFGWTNGVYAAMKKELLSLKFSNSKTC